MTRQLHACRLFPNRQHVETVRHLHRRKRGFMIHETLFHDSFLQMRYEEKTDYIAFIQKLAEQMQRSKSVIGMR